MITLTRVYTHGNSKLAGSKSQFKIFLGLHLWGVSENRRDFLGPQACELVRTFYTNNGAHTILGWRPKPYINRGLPTDTDVYSANQNGGGVTQRFSQKTEGV